MLSEFYEAVRDGLKEKLGCILFQFPSNFQYDGERLARITEMLEPALANVLEFRHPSWWNDAVYQALSEAKVAFCGMSHPALPETVVATTETLYYRFHGVPHLYNSRYEVQKLEHAVQEMLRQGGGRAAYVYFNNTADGHAITNAKQLQDICELVH
jgi:uncharacterized protein YecE (DUF72 family)